MEDIMFTKTLSFAMLGLLAAGCYGMPPEEAEGTSASSVIGGTDDSAHMAVGLIRTFSTAPGYAMCTATLIAPTVLLTAAHCAWNGDNGDVPVTSVDVSFALRPDLNAKQGTGPFALTGKIIPHPAFVPLAEHDVAVVLLSKPAVSAKPLALGRAPAVGSKVTAVGYGRNAYVNQGAGTKRTVDLPVMELLAHQFLAGTDVTGTCHGDSGGPLLQNGTIVGTTSYGATDDCHGINHFMRVDDNLPFLSQYIGKAAPKAPSTTPAPAPAPAPAPGGNTGCSISVQCQNGACQCGAGPKQGASCDSSGGLPSSCDTLCRYCQ
jgi:hypothetical protein